MDNKLGFPNCFTEIVTKLSQHGVVGMDKYNEIVRFMSKQGDDSELERIRKLSGMNNND